MPPVITIYDKGPLSCYLTADGVDDIRHIYRILLKAVMSVEREGIQEFDVPQDKLRLLRGFLASIGATDKGTAQRLLLMALLQLEDEDNEQRFVLPFPILPIATGRK